MEKEFQFVFHKLLHAEPCNYWNKDVYNQTIALLENLFQRYSQQIEIDEDVFSFGRNLFDSISKPSYISFLNSIYQYSNREYFMQSDGNDIQAVYDIYDETLSNNLMKDNSNKFDSLNIEFKLRLQQYNNRMNRNKLYVLK